MFLTDDELELSGQAFELEALFAKIDAAASPLTKELVDLIELRRQALQRRRAAEKEADDGFLATDLVRPWEGLVQVSSKAASSLQRDAFLQEWIGTLETIRGIAEVVSKDEHRPRLGGDGRAPWVPRPTSSCTPITTATPSTAGRRTMSTTTRPTPRTPTKPWRRRRAGGRASPGGGDEERTLNEVAPKLREAFAEPALRRMTEDGFVDLLWDIHASREYARRVPNAKIGLPGGVDHDMPKKSAALARRIWQDSIARGAPVSDVLAFILYRRRP